VFVVLERNSHYLRSVSVPKLFVGIKQSISVLIEGWIAFKWFYSNIKKTGWSRLQEKEARVIALLS
jgi:hypothetical protein